VFHMDAETCAGAGLIGWLVDGAAIITQVSLLETSYAPSARVLKRIRAEEGLHMQHGDDIILAMAMGTHTQRDRLQDALNRWRESLLFFFAPPPTTGAARRTLEYRIRVKTNEELRQQFLDKYGPQTRALGLKVPDPELQYDEEKKRWVYTPPDW